MGLIVVVLTVIVLALYAKGLSLLWDAGYWPLVAAVTPLTIGIAYYFSSPEDRAEFNDSILCFFRLRRR